MTDWQDYMRESDEEFPESRFDDSGETLNNEERGCGYLDEGKGYIRSDISRAGGDLPAFVEIPNDQRVPFKEEHFRTWKHFPGMQFELALIREAAELEPVGASPMEYVAAIKDGGFRDGELWEHLKRIAGSARPVDMSPGGSDHYGTMRVSKAHDLIMWVGETYYPQPEDYIEETRERGLNKAIGMSTRNPPPVVNPGKTRLWLIHPKGIDNHPEAEDIDEEERYTPGIVGYAYVTRCIYTEDSDGRIPDYIQRWEANGDLDVVGVGPEVSKEELEHESIDEAIENAGADDD